MLRTHGGFAMRHSNRLRWLVLVLASSLAVASVAQEKIAAPVIPREVLFGNPERASPEISPDGKQLASVSDRYQQQADQRPHGVRESSRGRRRVRFGLSRYHPAADEPAGSESVRCSPTGSEEREDRAGYRESGRCG